MLKKSKSIFDTGNWSEVNGLPGQQDMLNFMEDLVSRDPNECYTRRELMDEIAYEFEIPATAQEAEGPKSSTPGYYTRLSYLISGAVLGKWRNEDRPFLKRIATSCYQHISGNGVVSKSFIAAKVNRKYVKEAMVSVKILKDLSWDKERIYCELAGRSLSGWSDIDIELAIDNVFCPA